MSASSSAYVKRHGTIDRRLESDAVAVGAATTVATTVIESGTMHPGMMKTNFTIRGRLVGLVTTATATNATSIILYYGSTAIATMNINSIASGVSAGDVLIEFVARVSTVGASGRVKASIWGRVDSGASEIFPATNAGASGTAVDISPANLATWKVTAQMTNGSNASSNYTFQNAVIEAV